jgi:hypothetical protein
MCERICITEEITDEPNILEPSISLLTARKIRDIFCNQLPIGEIQKILVVNSCSLVKGIKGVVNFVKLTEEEKQSIATPPTGKYYKYGFVDFVWANSEVAQTLKRELQKESCECVIDVEINTKWKLSLQDRYVNLLWNSYSSTTSYIDDETQQICEVMGKYSFEGILEEECDDQDEEYQLLDPVPITYRDRYVELISRT